MSNEGDLLEQVARLFIDGFNRRDAESLVRLTAEEVDFHPTWLIGKRTVYRGHAGVRQWVSELETSTIKHEVRIREVKALDETNFLVNCDVLVDGEMLSPAALLGRVNDRGQIVEAHSYLSDEPLLARLGLVPQPTAVTDGPPPATLS